MQLSFWNDFLSYQVILWESFQTDLCISRGEQSSDFLTQPLHYTGLLLGVNIICTQLCCCRCSWALHSLKLHTREQNHRKSEGSQAIRANCKEPHSTAEQHHQASGALLPHLQELLPVPMSRRIPQSVFPQVSSDRWAVYQVQGLIFLSLVYRGKPISLISYPCLSTWQAVGRDCPSQRHRHFQWLLTAMSSDGNEPFPAQRKELLGPNREVWGLFTAFLNWRCQRDVNLMLPNIKHKIPLMSVAVTRAESQWAEGAHKSPWRWGQALQENNEIHSVSLEGI